MKLQEKKAVVTGGGRGIGRTIALTLAREGADVAVCARTMADVEKVADEMRQMGRDSLGIRADISRDEDVEALRDRVLEAFGHVDILVNNAAAFAWGHVVDMRVEDWDRVLNTNLRGTFLVTRAFLPAMIERKEGSIVNISSTSGKRGDPGGSAYSASKFGIMGFSHSLLYEAREHNIRVVVVSPSKVDTSVGEPNDDGRFVRSQDIAETVLLAVSLPNQAMIREVEIWGTNP